MTPSEAAEIEAKKTYAAFIKYSKAAVYWILAILILLAFLILVLTIKQAVSITVKCMHQ